MRDSVPASVVRVMVGRGSNTRDVPCVVQTIKAIDFGWKSDTKAEKKANLGHGVARAS